MTKAKSKIRGGDPERKWRELIDRQSKSGDSIQAFCRSRELNESSFYYWRKKIELRERDAKGTSLAPVVVIDEMQGESPIEIVLADGTKVRVGAKSTREQFAMVIDVLEASRC